MQADLDHCQETASLLIGLDFPSDTLRKSLFRFGGYWHSHAIVACLFEAFVPLVQALGLSRQDNRASRLLEEEHNDDHLAGESSSAELSNRIKAKRTTTPSKITCR